MSPDAPDPGPDFDALLDFLHVERRFDFRGYKRGGLARRVTKRMLAAGFPDMRSYRDYLRETPDEFVQLFNTILINVTAFFRDGQPWEYLRTEVLPPLLAAKRTAEPIRAWCAGCATGEEAYTLAIVLAEVLGIDQFRDRVKIYATDIDDEALTIARQGSYDERDVADLPPDLRDRYFERDGVRWSFRKDLRRLLIFGRNDLMQDAPISRVDLLTCRNTLMYFDAPTQGRVLTRFHFALNPGGVLVLGRAETLLSQTILFAPLDLRRRVFVKAPSSAGRERSAAARALTMHSAMGEGAMRSTEGDLRDAVFDAGTLPQLVVDRVGLVGAVNERARALFQLGSGDIGRPLQDLEVSYRPFELRSLIDQVYSEGRTVVRGEVPWRVSGGDMRWFDIVVHPLLVPVVGTSGEPRTSGSATPAFAMTPAGVMVTFTEVTRHKQLQEQLHESQAELEAAYQELQSTNEELETTNEELHSTVEELETTNEELQSTNEELETMNEELQSTNEELQTINDELRQRSDELNRVNSFLESVFTSLGSGVAVLDRELRVLIWNSHAENLWGLRADEVVGQYFLNLDIGLHVGRLVDVIRAALTGHEAWPGTVLPATNRRGRAIRCRTSVLSLITRNESEPTGVIVLMEELPPDGPDDATPAIARPPVIESPVADTPVAESPVADPPIADAPVTDRPADRAPEPGSENGTRTPTPGDA